MKYLVKNKHWEINKEYNIDKILYLLIDRPDKITNTLFYWFNKRDNYSRDYDFPSVLLNNEIAWYNNGVRCRKNSKPVILNTNGCRLWWYEDY